MKRDDGMSAVKSRSRGKLLTDFWDSGYNAEGFIAEESLLRSTGMQSHPMTMTLDFIKRISAIMSN